jgi:hypothetical protein
MGSPCLNPRLHEIHGPGTPLIRTADLEELRTHRIRIHLLHLELKPRAARILSELSQLTVSNAFAKSSLTTIVGIFLLYHVWTISAAYTKDSEMDRPCRNPVWFRSIKFPISFCNLQVVKFWIESWHCSSEGKSAGRNQLRQLLASWAVEPWTTC